MAFERRGSALELVAIPCTKLQGGVSRGHHRETMGDEGCREKGGAEKERWWVLLKIPRCDIDGEKERDVGLY